MKKKKWINIYMICATLSVTYDQFRKSSSFSLIEDGPVHPAYFWVISLS